MPRHASRTQLALPPGAHRPGVPRQPPPLARVARVAPHALAGVLAAVAAGAGVACSAAQPATPEQRLVERLRGGIWEGTMAPLEAIAHADLAVMRAHPSHTGERLEFRDSTVVFTRYGATLEAVYAAADSTHLRVRPLGAAGGRTVLLTFAGPAGRDTLRLIPNPFPAEGVDAAATGEWARPGAGSGGQ